MKNNYAAWEIPIEDFFDFHTDEERLQFLVRFAVLAPSSHNSQPWKFHVKGNSLFIIPNMERRLPDSDKNNRQLFLSLGCAAANVLVAADYYGFRTTVRYSPNGADSGMRIDVEPSTPKRDQSDHLIFSIPKRVNNRNKYFDRMPEQSFLDGATSLGSEGLSVNFITDRALRHSLADVAVAAGVAAMEDDAFRHELSGYVKSNTTSSPTGMPAFGMGIPTPLSYLAPFLVSHFNMNKGSRATDLKLFKDHTPMFGIIATNTDTQEDWMRCGQVYEQIALMACQKGIATAVWAAPIQIGEFYKEFKKILSTDRRPQFFFRIGYAAHATPHSPRILAKEVLERS